MSNGNGFKQPDDLKVIQAPIIENLTHIHIIWIKPSNDSKTWIRIDTESRIIKVYEHYYTYKEET